MTRAGPGDRLSLTTGFALLLHAVALFGIEFTLEDPLAAASDPAPAATAPDPVPQAAVACPLSSPSSSSPPAPAGDATSSRP